MIGSMPTVDRLPRHPCIRGTLGLLCAECRGAQPPSSVEAEFEFAIPGRRSDAISAQGRVGDTTGTRDEGT